MTDPSAWGPSLWRTMHTFAHAYPPYAPDDATRAAAEAFYESLPLLMPCAECAQWCAQWLHRFPVRDAAFDRDRLARWVYTMHCAVNAKLGKPNTVSYDQARQWYERASNGVSIHARPVRFASLKDARGDPLLITSSFQQQMRI